MADELKEYIRANPCQGFASEPFYSKAGDFLSVFFKDEDHYAHRVDSILTTYLSMDKHKLIGFKVKGIRRILDTLEHFKDFVHIAKDGAKKIKIRIFLMPGMAVAHSPERRELYQEVDEATGNLTVDADELQPA